MVLVVDGDGGGDEFPTFPATNAEDHNAHAHSQVAVAVNDNARDHTAYGGTAAYVSGIEGHLMTRIHHLALRVRDLDAIGAFYGTWLNLTVVRDLSPRALWLGIGDGAVLMLEQRGIDEPAIDPRSLELVAFAIDEAGRSALRARLVAAHLLEGETDHTLYFRDPEGRRVAVSSYPL